jgi:uncharacterized protein YdiU (UPF0061 family)
LGVGENKELLSGSQIHGHINPFAVNYSGHQYGIYCSLGEGRTLNLGILDNLNIQIRGSGPTAFAHEQDGFIPLKESIFEYLISETLANLKIPCYRTLAVIGSNQACFRQNKANSCGITTRFAPSWIRFGTFENLFYRGDTTGLKSLVDYVIQEFYPDCIEKEHKEFLVTKNLISSDFYDTNQDGLDESILAPANEIKNKLGTAGHPISIPLNRYAIFFRRVIEKTASLIAHWQANGFVHGLLNTVCQY